MATFTCIAEPFHIWIGASGQVMVSDERVKALRAFDSVDAAINALFLEGNRATARTLNNAWKEHLYREEEIAASRRYHQEAVRRGRFVAAPFERD